MPFLPLPVIALPFFAAPDPPGGPRLDFSAASALLARAVEERAFPGCAVAVGTSKGVLWSQGFGKLTYGGGAEATPTTLYDLASLTKVVGATAVVLALVRDGKISLADPLSRYLPEFPPGVADPHAQEERRGVTIEHLLTHSSGLPGWKPLYRSAGAYQQLLAAIIATPLEAPPGAREEYSDLGFILLGEAAGRAAGRSLPELERTLVFEPLGMADTRRDPPAAWRERIPPTEIDGEAGGFLRGVVHDENARAGEGKTAHAGLFSTAEDLARFAGELLRGRRGDSRVFPRPLIEEFSRRRGLVAGSSRALGWDTPSAPGSAGSLLSPRSFGHTGFTGTSLWIDPERDLYVVLLSNRIHPRRDNQKILAVRPALADAVARAYDAATRRRRRL
jgi:CubicO group peptidase (beta-lactamase class C family)